MRRKNSRVVLPYNVDRVKRFVTARKRSLRRLCFYTCLSVILFTGGSASVHAGIADPPGADTPRSRHPTEQTPPRAVHAGRVGGTHPIGMHTCLDLHFILCAIYWDHEAS